jgi:hypothetical protein
MGFGGGFSSGGKTSGLNVVSGSHGQLLRFHSGSGAVIGTDDHKIDDAGHLGITGSLNVKGSVRHSGSIVPENNDDELGSSDNKYSNINSDSLTTTNLHTGDLHMQNERGSWTLHEERNCLIARNNLTGEKFKFLLEKIEKK